MSKTHDEPRIQMICLIIIAATAVAAGLFLLRDVLVPFVLAVFLAIGLTPLVNLQTRRLRMPHALAVILTLVLAFVALALVGTIAGRSMTELAANAETYEEGIADLLDNLATTLGVDLAATGRDAGQGVQKLILSTTRSVFSVLSQGILVLIFLSFLLFGSTIKSNSSRGTWSDILARTQKYIVTKIAVSAITGVLVGLTLWILGVPLALVFGLLAFLLNFIPSIGSIISTLLPVPVVLLTPSMSPFSVILAIAIPGTIQFVVGNIVEPKIMGKSTGLHPITILLALAFWGTLWGIVGMFLATPLTAMIRILLDKSDLCRPIADLMAGRFKPAPDGQAEQE